MIKKIAIGCGLAVLLTGIAAIENARSGVQSDVGELRGSLGPQGPAANQDRIAKFKKLLQDNLALASFGL